MQRYGMHESAIGDDGVTTGLVALDAVLAGGYARAHLHLLEGRPGSGKTTLALQFLIAGRDAGERALYITLSESEGDLRHAAASHGMSLDGIAFCELVPPEMSLDPAQEQSVVYASDLELGETVTLVMNAVMAHAPQRVVFDSLSEIRMLAHNPLRYRRQVLALKHFFARQGCTVLLLDDLTNESDDVNLHSLAHGVVRLEQNGQSYGADRRRLRVFKMRTRNFLGGYHDYTIERGGIRLFPRLIAARHEKAFDEDEAVSSGIVELDRMFGGGFDRGTSTLLIGPSGAGKSTLAMQFVDAALRRGERALFISFDETIRNFIRRNERLGFPVEQALADRRLTVCAIDPAELTPGQMTDLIRDQVNGGVTAVVLDSLSGYHHAMPEERHLLLQMHELLSYLNGQNVLTFLTLAQAGMVGAMQSPFDLTYLADSVLLLRFFEAQGEIRRVISVIKRRTGGHERALREMQIGPGGIKVGPQLTEFRGILTGVPTLDGSARAGA